MLRPLACLDMVHLTPAKLFEVKLCRRRYWRGVTAGLVGGIDGGVIGPDSGVVVGDDNGGD